jgi:hypothetical protein
VVIGAASSGEPEGDLPSATLIDSGDRLLNASSLQLAATSFFQPEYIASLSLLSFLVVVNRQTGLSKNVQTEKMFRPVQLYL